MYREPVRPSPGPNWMGISFLLLAVFVALLGVAIVQSRVAGPAATERPTGTPATASERPSGPSPDASTEVSAQPTEPAGPTDAASASPGESTAAPSPGDVSACTGTDENREFLAIAAENIPFVVYCAALPEDWGLTRGTYSGRGAGFIELGYRGPGGATILLREGDPCEGEDDCPPGEAIGEAAFGDLEGELRAVGEEFAIVVEGDDVVYLLELTGVDEATARDLGEAMLRIE